MENTGRNPEDGRLKAQIASLGPWFHNIHLDGGVQTAPDNRYGDFPNFKWQQFKDHIPENLDGWTALDIGCNAGFYSFELAKRGASVLGIDLDPHYLAQATWLADELGFAKKVRFELMQVYDLMRIDRKFDIVIFMGVFYHLRYPMLALDIVAEKVNRLLVFQTLTAPGSEVYTPAGDMGMDDRDAMMNEGWPKMAFIEKRLAGDPTNWWAPNHSCILAMLNTCGLRQISNPGHEIYLFEPDKNHLPVSQTWNRSEFLSATGKSWMEELPRKIQHS